MANIRSSISSGVSSTSVPVSSPTRTLRAASSAATSGVSSLSPSRSAWLTTANSVSEPGSRRRVRAPSTVVRIRYDPSTPRAAGVAIDISSAGISMSTASRPTLVSFTRSTNIGCSTEGKSVRSIFTSFGVDCVIVRSPSNRTSSTFGAAGCRSIVNSSSTSNATWRISEPWVSLGIVRKPGHTRLLSRASEPSARTP